MISDPPSNLPNRIITILTVITLFAVALFLASSHRRIGQAVNARQINLSLGDSLRFSAGNVLFELSVPSGPDNSESYGTFSIRQISAAFDSGPLERDGRVASLLVGDVNADKCPDVVIVVQSAGSGSYVSIVCVLTNGVRYQILQVPEPPSSLTSGYLGHDQVSLENGSIVRRFPTYVDSSGLRIDKQWSASDLIHGGKLPIKRSPDSNSEPSGRSGALSYSVTANKWSGSTDH